MIRLMCLFICGWTGRLSILSTQGQDATTAAGPQNCPCCASRAAGIKGGCIGTVRGYPKPYTLTLNYYTRLQTRASFVVAECILGLPNQVLCEACQGPAGWLWKKREHKDHPREINPNDLILVLDAGKSGNETAIASSLMWTDGNHFKKDKSVFHIVYSEESLNERRAISRGIVQQDERMYMFTSSQATWKSLG